VTPQPVPTPVAEEPAIMDDPEAPKPSEKPDEAPAKTAPET
jgi:hypothetical protein